LHQEVYGGARRASRSPLIGRATQLELLESLYGRAAQGESAAVLLWGEAGIGKTRLLDEFASRALALGAKVGRTACFESLCPPFAPLHEAFATLGISDAFEDRDPSGAGDQSETARHRALLRAVEAFRTAAVTPIVLMIDDLQWTDYATLEFLSFLAARPTGRWLFLGAVRSEQLELDHSRREALSRLERQGTVTVAVPPLDTDEMRRLVTSIWPSHSANADRAIQRVCELAEGKPYFAEELVNSAAIAPEGPFLEAPLSIRAGVLARFERLAPEERRILLYASVIGRSFDVPLLAQIAGVSGAVAATAIARARDLQLVRETREADGALTFRHAITREILYRELLAFQTQTIHREIAECLTGLRDADPIDLAYHWNAAGDRERASAAYELAGDSALSRSAHRDAEVAYRGAAASRNPDDATYAPLCEKFSRALSINGQVEEACAVAELAVNAYAAAGDAGRAAAVAIRLARRVYESGRPQAAEATALRALRLSGGTGRVAYGAYVTLAHFAALQGATDAAGAYLVSAEETPGEHSALDRRNACMVRALIAAISGRLINAFEEYERAAAIARDSNDSEQLAWTLNNYASRAMTTGWMDRALAAYHEAARCARSQDFGKVGATTIQGLAFSQLLAGDLGAVRAYQREDARLPPGIAMTQTARTALAVRLAYYGDDDAEAARCITPATLDLAFSSGESQRIGLLAGCVAAYYDATKRREEADALRTRALRELNSVDFSFWLLDQLAGSANAEERTRARELLAEAARDPANRAARAHLTLFDARLANRRRAAAAKTLAAEAAAQFEQIGWPWEQAQALELAGRPAEAVELYRRHGFLRPERELARARQRARHRPGRQQLTARELEVARLAAQGKSNRAIATDLFIGERTVETHIAAIFDRFDLTSRRQLAVLVADSPEQGEAKPPS
jgi:DNA-binding CsgD family transcriptional regulator/type II secretory pathway predicted ATPase ExeA